MIEFDELLNKLNRIEALVGSVSEQHIKQELHDLRKNLEKNGLRGDDLNAKS